MTADSIDNEAFDAIVIGGGFYGCAIAVYLAKQRKLRRVRLIERESGLLTRASYRNQARVHNGYHYPRSFTTAYRSRVNLPQFVREWPAAVSKDFTKLYAIARRNSKVNARQFKRFCRDIGATLEPADASVRQLFDARLVEDVFVAQEYAFDAVKLAAWASHELSDCGVEVQCEARALEIHATGDNRLRTVVQHRRDGAAAVTSRFVFNCTYSGMNQIAGDYPGTFAGLKQEITEMALVEMPQVLSRLGITVMDGPFFSAMPFPSRRLHTLSHVRYTPHLNRPDRAGDDPYDTLERYSRHSRFDRMVRDVARYLPAIRDARFVESIFEIKTVLAKNEADDGRPILFEKHAALPGCYSVLGGKIDNIYDVLERAAMEPLA